MDTNTNTPTMSIGAAPRSAGMRPAGLCVTRGSRALQGTDFAVLSTESRNLALHSATTQIARDHAAFLAAPHSTTRNDVKQAPPPRGVPR